MKTILRAMAAASAAVLLSACALLAPMRADDDARHGAKVALAAYELTQRAALIYGNLKLCNPDPRAAYDYVCCNAAVWAKIRAADKAAVAAIVAATPVLNAETADTGQILNALSAIATVKAAVNEALAQIKGPKAPAGAT